VVTPIGGGCDRYYVAEAEAEASTGTGGGGDSGEREETGEGDVGERIPAGRYVRFFFIRVRGILGNQMM
jgi:hypothetical protein